MKIRTDFVSNSSSSSFVAWGVHIDGEKILEFIKKAKEWSDEDLKAEIEKNGLYDVLYYSFKLPEDVKLSMELPHYEDCDEDDFSVMMGLIPTKMGEDETLREFKDRIHTELVKVFPGNYAIKYIEYFSGG